MPSVKNPNKPSRNRMAARAAHSRKQQRKRSAEGQLVTGAGPDTDKEDMDILLRVAKADTKRGARAGLLPTSGPRAPLSAKKQKKVIQRMALALKRKMAAEGVAVLEGEAVAADKAPSTAAVEAAADDQMELETTAA